MRSPAHIMIGDQTWCDWTGCQAGADINRKVGIVTCSHGSTAGALRAAKLLRPHFRKGVVKVVAGRCSHDGKPA